MQHILDVQFPDESPMGAPGGDYQEISSNPSMFGATRARALQTFGQGLEKAGAEGIDVATEHAQQDARTHADELHSWQSDQVTDAQEKFLQLRGRAAQDALPAFKEQIDGIRQQAVSQAGNPYTQRLVESEGRRLTDIAYSQGARHAASQQAEWDTNTAVDGAAAAGSRAAIAAQTTPGYASINANPAVVLSLDKSDNLARQAANLKGLDGDIEAQRNRGKNVLQIVKDGVASGSQAELKRAIEFYHAQRDRIDPATSAQIAQALKHQSSVYNGQNRADAIMGTGPYLPAGYQSRTIQIESGGNPNAQSGSHGGLVGASKEWEARYGLNDSNRNDPTAVARALSMENAENHNALASALGHEPTPSDYYLAHQQGIAGAVSHLSQPNLPAWQNMYNTVEGHQKGAGWAKAAIWGNMTPEMKAQFPGGVETVTSGDYARMWAQRFYNQPIQASGIAPGNGTQQPAAGMAPSGIDRLQAAQAYSQSSKAETIQSLMNDPWLRDHPQDMSAAISRANQVFEVQSAQYADAERQLRIQAQQTKLISDGAEDQYMQQIYAPPANAKPISVQQIVTDPRLSPVSKARLIAKIGKSEDKDEKTYGAGFVHALQMVHAPAGTDGRITDPEQLLPRVGGDITFAGYQKLRDEINLKKSPEGDAESKLKQEFLRFAKSRISGTDAGLGIKDPKGDELYLKFMAQALPRYDAGRREGKTPSQLLSPDSADYIGKGLIDQPGHGFVRPMQQWFSDTIADQPGATASKGAFDASTIKALPDLVAAFRAGSVTREQARALALQNGWASEKPKVPVSQ